MYRYQTPTMIKFDSSMLFTTDKSFRDLIAQVPKWKRSAFIRAAVVEKIHRERQQKAVQN